jgi:arylformamidase
VDSSYDFSDPANIDCLVCHDTTGLYRKDIGKGGLPDSALDLAEIARRVGRPSRRACGSCHFVSGGTPIDQIPVKHLIGEAIVGDFSYKKRGSGITSEDIKKVLLDDAQIKEGDILLFYTGCSRLWGNPEVNNDFTYLSGEAAEYLVSKKIRAIGIDFLSIEEFHSQDHKTHKTLLSNGIFIIESLNKELKRFVGQRILFMSFPIKFQGGDGAPCRAVAVPKIR